MAASFSSFYVFVITASQEYILAEFAEGPFIGDAIVLISGERQIPETLAPKPRLSESEFQDWIERVRADGLNVEANVSIND